MESKVEPKIVIRRVREPDIDLLLMEEFVASEEFCKWFFGLIGIEMDATLLQVERSVASANGESDLEVTLRAGGKQIKVLIENKIDAILQPDQPERYVERGKQYCADGVCDRVITVAIAPSVYFESKGKHCFDFFIKYESVLERFKSAEWLGERRTYKVAALRQAIEKGRQGWQSVPDPNTTQFWRSYFEKASKVAPELRMDEPGSKPENSGFIPFFPLSLDEEMELIHKVMYGNVDLQFGGMGDKLQVLQKRFGEFLTDGMRIEKAAKSAVIRMRVDKIDMQSPFKECEPAIMKALDAAVNLLRMYQKAKKGKGK